MLFNSFSFLQFFIIVTVAYYFLPHKARLLLLFVASCYFYMVFIPAYVLVLFVLILIDYFMGIKIAESKGKKRKKYLLISIFSMVAMLFAFKYFNFFNANFEALAEFIGWNYPIGYLKLILPLGISFHTFQSLSYVIEVYRKKQKPEKNLLVYALYVMFFPQLVAGPIERPQHMLHQFHTKKKLLPENVTIGLRFMVIGFFKKVVIADRVAVLANNVYAHPGDFMGVPLILGTIAFAIQIYCDFSGYSDIARGSAKVLGFNLVQNFKSPYIASSISEFWRRWHISLSSWFRDYVYIPLGGNRVRLHRYYFNIFITFLLSGLWHGASWNFVIWGALNGLYLIGEHALSPAIRYYDKIVRIGYINKLSKVLFVFILVCIGWVFFRAQSFQDATYILGNSLDGAVFFIKQLLLFNIPAVEQYVFNQGNGLGFSGTDMVIAVSAVAFLGLIEYLQNTEKLLRIPRFFRWGVYVVCVLAIINLGVIKETPFIYFQF